MRDEPNRQEPIRLRILGPLRVASGDAEVHAGPRQQRSLLAVLLARVNQPSSLHGLIEQLWDDNSPPSAVNIVHKYVGALRRVLEPGLAPRAPGAYLRRHGNGYLFAAGPASLDLVLFRRSVAEAKASAERGELDAALDRYLQALPLVSGPAGDGLADTAAAQATFASVDLEFFDTVAAAADLAIGLRRPPRLLAPLRLAASMDPLNEVIQARLVTMLAAAGQQAEALRSYQSIRGRLVDELGIEPGRELQEAHRRVLTDTVLVGGGLARWQEDRTARGRVVRAGRRRQVRARRLVRPPRRP